MAEIQMDKVKSVLAQMDDEFWQALIERGSAAYNKAKDLAAAFMEDLSKLSALQFEIVETKYKGYQQLAENKKKAAVSGIVKANKDSLDALAEQKRQLAATLAGYLIELAAVVEEMQTMGTNGK